MHRIIKLPLFVFLICLGAGLSTPAQDKPVPAKTSTIAKLSWIMGEWKNDTDTAKTIYEIWRGTNTGELSGRGLAVTGTDTVVTEKLWIRPTDSGLFYIADVPHNEAPIWFKMTEVESTQVVFENPAHDFPKRISYRSIGEDSLHARISGSDAGDGHDFYFVRKKE
jgi:hypothetical protein